MVLGQLRGASLSADTLETAPIDLYLLSLLWQHCVVKVNDFYARMAGEG
jgi:hypothetical protein